MGARASVLPAGSDPVVKELKPGKHKLTITSVRENNELTVQYPCGWTRDHQAKDMPELAPKIVNNLRARYGVESVSVTQAPTSLKKDAVIEIEV